MSEARKTHHLTGRRARIIGAATALVLAASGILSQSASAQVGDDSLPTITKDLAHAVLAHGRKAPANAVRASHRLPSAGSYGAAFQKPAALRSGVQSRIVGGTIADPSAFPSVVGIESLFLAADDTGTVSWWISTCTGTVISPTKVLTAGHCAVDLPLGTTVVIAGRSNLDSDTGGFVAPVSSVWTDQQFNLAALYAGTTDVPQHDVSVLTLGKPLPSAYTPISLTAQGDSTPYASGTSATIVGYGVTSSNATDEGTLRQATVSIQSNATCTSAMPGYDSTTMTCAGVPAGGVDSCFGDSGGPIIVGGAQVGITDWGSALCGSAGTYGVYERLSYYHDAVAADVAARPIVNLDFSGDGHTDLLTRKSNGELWEYSGSGLINDGYGGFAGWARIGTGWNGYTKLFRVTNWNGDGTESIFAETSTGALYQYKTDGAGSFVGGATLIGTAWNTFVDIMVTNNWTGTGRPNVMGRKANGDLYLYESDGAGGWTNGGIGIKIGTGWNMFNTVLTPGDWRGNGQALIGRTPGGDLLLYESDGHGGWKNSQGIKIGTGWQIMTVFFSPGDWNGDDLQDMIGIRSNGTVSVYESDGHGNWLTPLGVSIGSGWNTFTAIF